MKPLSEDTAPWAEELQLGLLRSASPQRRLAMALDLSATVWNMARAAIDRRYAHETQAQRDYRFVTHLYGEEQARRTFASPPNPSSLPQAEGGS